MDDTAATLPFHLRIAALQCNFEGSRQNTLNVPKLWNSFGFNTEQLFHTHSELYSAVFRKEAHTDILRDYIEKSRKNGIQIILYMNCHILLESQNDRAEDWAQVDRNGEYIRSYGTYHACCLNSSWTDFFLESIESLKEFDIRGIFFDGPSSSSCFCSRCCSLFEKEYGLPPDQAEEQQIDRFRLRTIIRFIKRIYEKTKKVNPGWLSYVNANLMHARASAEEMREILSYNDIIGTEGGFQFYGPPSDTDIWRCGMHAKFVEAASGDKRRVIFMAGDQKPWSWYMHTPTETKLCYASVLANGASVWYGIHSSTQNLKGVSGRAVQEMVQFDKKHDHLYQNTESAADTALFFSYNTSKHYTSSGEATDFYGSEGLKGRTGIGNYTDSFRGAYGMLFRSCVPFDVVTELNIDSLSTYSVLILPTCACMSRDTVLALKEFVTNGGTLISDSETALYSDTFEKQENFMLNDLLGVSFKGYRSYRTHDYFTCDTGPIKSAGVEYIPAPLTAVDAVPAEIAQVCARLCPPLAGRYSDRPESGVYPFIIKNGYGSGTSWYFAGRFFELYSTYGIPHYKEILNTILTEHSSPCAELLNAPESIEVTVRFSGTGDTLMVHLVNYSGGMNRPITDIIPVSGLVLKVNRGFSSARTLLSGTNLEPDANGLLHLPELREFEVVCIE